MDPVRRAARAIARTSAALDALDRAAADDLAYPLRTDGSKWSIGEHLAHLAAANALTLSAARTLVEGGDARIVARARPNLLGRLVLLLGWIPRGRGQAPVPTRPPPETDAAALRAALADNRELLLVLAPERTAAARGGLPHPALGVFDAFAWVRFTEVHTRHHLKIVDEIREGGLLVRDDPHQV